jgi:hypothetical protein
MLRSTAALTALALLSLTACNKKPKLEGKIVGFKSGSTTDIVVHAKAIKGAHVWCSNGGYGCDPFDMPASGEKDFDVDMSKGSFDTPKKIMLTATYHDKNEEKVPLDVAASVPPALAVNSFGGFISCPPRECLGNVDVLTSSVNITVPAGSTLQIGSTKLTADAQGKIEGPVAFAPAPKDVALAKLCDANSTLTTLPVSMTFSDKATSSASLNLTMEDLRSKVLELTKGVKKGPVAFPWEKGAAAKHKPGVIIQHTSSCSAGGASDAHLEDLRVVVFTEEKGTRADKCKYAFNDGTSATANITMHDQAATAYDRATGKVLGTKAFEAKKSCDYSLTTKTKNLTDQDAWPDSKAVAAWGATLAR